MVNVPQQELKYRLTLSLSTINKSADVYSDATNPDSRRIETGLSLTEKVIESNSLTELKAGLADFRTNLRES